MEKKARVRSKGVTAMEKWTCEGFGMEASVLKDIKR